MAFPARRKTEEQRATEANVLQLRPSACRSNFNYSMEHVNGITLEIDDRKTLTDFNVSR